MNSTTTPKRIESRDNYHRPGQLNSSAEKAKRNLDIANPTKTPFFTNLTSVNIATAFAHANITSSTINRRPAHLKGTPMSPSQIPKMNLRDLHEDHDPRAHFESSVAPRPHGIRPIRDITAKIAAAGRSVQLDYQDMDIDSAPLYRDHLDQNTSAMPDGFLRDRSWKPTTHHTPGWVKRANDIADISPPTGLFKTPNVPGRPSVNSAAAAAAAALHANQHAEEDLIDLQTPSVQAQHGTTRAAASGRYLAGGSAAGFGKAAMAGSSLYNNDENSWRHNPSSRANGLGGYTSSYTNGNNRKLGATASAADSVSYENTNTRSVIGNAQANRIGTRRTPAYSSNIYRSQDRAGSAYSQSKSVASNVIGAVDKYHGGNENDEVTDVNGGDDNASRANSRYMLRSRLSTPGRLSYDNDFNLREAGHDEYLRDHHTETASRKTAPIPTPYTAHIRGPGAFPATAQRFSQRKSASHDAADDDILSPTAPRRPGARTASGNAALTSGDLLSNHRYLSHGNTSHRGWGEYAPHHGDAAERDSVHSFGESFISNSTAGGGNGSSEDKGFEGDNPTLLKRLFRNIAAGWTGSAGSFAERLSFIFFMFYFLIKETALVVGAFVYRLLCGLVLGPVYSGIRETILLPASLLRVLAPGSSRDTARSMTGILTGLTVVALSIIVTQYGHAFFGSLGAVPKSLFKFGWIMRSPQRSMPSINLQPLSDEDIQRLGGHGSVVVDRLVGFEQMLKHLYSLLDTLKSQSEEDTVEVRDTLKRLQQERQSLLDNNRGDQKRMDSLEREHVSMKRDLKASLTKNADSKTVANELDKLKQYVEKLAKSSGGSKWGRGSPSLDEVRRLINEAIKAQEQGIRDMLKPEWLTSDGDAAYTHVSRMIEDALSRYSNDRLGKTDFALFSAGARIIPGLTSPTFEPPARGLTQKLWRKMGMISSQPPVAILDPNTHIGECWPMQGSSGQVAIHLAQPVGVSDFAIEHVAKSIAIDWRSAPREIEVWGYIIGSEDSTVDIAGASNTSETANGASIATEVAPVETNITADLENKADAASDDVVTILASPAADSGKDSSNKGGRGIVNPPLTDSKTKHGLGRLTKLASFEYEPSDTSALQVIRPAVGDGSALRMRTIILKIKSNWGHPEHTCIYRFRVHGHLVAL
ncbi:hypothetical protein GGI25_001316 [Coemansia spiralis]|uniref:SUN domain-containing protein n=2 Tax=Coemansia TaxID=4863 RepID=A0A9W8GCT9_9FUNG|nr:hypothetical protein EDC05_001178 [Coemansia umbellata]KAJ2624017.1 hypothetical protein GGI26_001810 [Coemansia sp. RSA 1358]KAJ2679626.1 hypothetical protein GGI25_001316 [Coemansia spiralis]